MPISQDELHSLERVLPELRSAVSESIEKGPARKGRLLNIAGSKIAPEAQLWFYAAPHESAPLLVYLHGGGFSMGDARKSDALLGWTCAAYGVAAVGVNYRLAPEHPFPAGVDDVQAAVEWCAHNSEKLGIDADRIYFVGFSAGACLSIAAAMRLGKSDDVHLAGIINHYPFYDCATDPSSKGSRDDAGIPVAMAQAFNAWYVGKADSRNPFASPVLASTAQLACLPPVVMMPVVGDSLFEEAGLLARRIRNAGVPCAFIPVEGAYHGYIEDAANVRVYHEIESPETIDARPHGYLSTAEQSYEQALGVFFNREKAVASFDGFHEA